ncbi:hypothetical protein A7K95_05475 [Pediococcus parvulus]|uniref:Glycosyl transferase n=1 Tax=Pediococcus parvulus TaxID=54062 RepID=A0ABX2UGJ5_9LACO|nr:glycosyltransferase family 4 protein [Pediococcus parvulus]OAD64305.1 hypothetical protein A7K95_05475 [Pediococcus parvulus]
MKIMYCITRSDWGGAQAHLIELIKYFNKQENEICLVVGEEGVLTDRVQEIPGVQIIVENKLQRSINLFWDIQTIFKLRKIIKKFCPDVVHLHSSKAGAIGRLAAWGLPCKVIFTAHGWAFTEGVRQPQKTIYALMERLLAKLSDRIICVSDFDYKIAIKHHIFSFHDTKGIVIRNGIKINDWVKTNKESKEDEFILTMVARFDDPKDQLLLVNSIEKIKNLKIRVNLVGNGPTLNVVRKKVSDKKLQRMVYFNGFQKDVSKILKQSDCFILLSNHEGLPISILEAMNFELPIIGSNVGGIPEEIETGVNGFLVSNKINDVARAIKNLYFNEANRYIMGEKSKIKLRKDFDINSMLEKVSKVYKELITIY